MAEDASADAGRIMSFGPFRLIPSQQLLTDGGGQAVALGSRAFNLLITLVARAGDLVTKEELISSTWPDTFVEESNLRVHVAGLRRALGDGQAGTRYIATVPGRGYRFVAPVAIESSTPSAAPAATTSPAAGLPRQLTRMVGRAELVASLSRQLVQHRFLTLVGPGGIGKTTVAVAIAGEVASGYPDGVFFIDLAPVSDPRLVPGAFATLLGLTVQSEDQIRDLVAFAKDKRALLVLDSCEHVIDAAATFAEELLGGAAEVHILATSREPLRSAGERIHRLAPLATPDESAGLTAAAALAFPGVELFVERARASLDGFELSDADAPAVADICRRLDGIALAIELAARRVDAFGVDQLAAHLDDRFRLLTSGRRTALPRHQTLGATLDWSYDLLPASESAVLRRVAFFAGGFSLDAAIAVAGDLPEAQVVDHVANLVAKSLIVADLRGEGARYRLLDTTRLYGLEKLRSNGEFADAARRHAGYFLRLFANAEVESEARPQAEWLTVYGRHIDNVRAALNWAFSVDGDFRIGVALTVAVVPLWVQLSLLAECRERVSQALESLGNDPDADRPRMQLSAALGWALMYGVGRAREAAPAWATALQLAEKLDDRDYRQRALWGLCIDQFNNGEFRAALEFARRFADLVGDSTDPIDQIMGNRILATSLHYLGDQNAARHHIDRVIAHLSGLTLQSQIVRLRFDMRVSTHYFQARILWLQGFADEALRIVARNIEEGRAIGHALSFCSVLGQGACPIAFLSGDFEAAARYGTMLLEHTERHPVRLWQLWARCFTGLVDAKRGDDGAGLQALRSGLEQAGDARFLPRFLLLLGELAAGLGAAGDVGLGIETVDQAITRCEARDERWYFAELLRIKAELILAQAAADAARQAEDHLMTSLDWARRQGALSWELRSATSLAKLYQNDGREKPARELLSEIYGRFSEGFDGGDLVAAREMLARG